MGPCLEGADHAPDRFLEKHANCLLQDTGTELEIDVEIDHRGAIGLAHELPVVVEITERSIQILDVDPVGSIERDLGGKCFAENLETDGKIGPEHIALAPF